MKVKLTKDQLVGPRWQEAGDVVDVDPRRGEQMIRDNAAERAEAIEDADVESPPDHASRRVVEAQTGRPPRIGVPELTGEIDPVAPVPGEAAVKVGSTEVAEVVANPDGSLVQVAVEDAASESVRPSRRGGPARPADDAKAAEEPKEPAKDQLVGPKGQPLKQGDAK